jgi:hypothetical protein
MGYCTQHDSQHQLRLAHDELSCFKSDDRGGCPMLVPGTDVWVLVVKFLLMLVFVFSLSRELKLCKILKKRKVYLDILFLKWFSTTKTHDASESWQHGVLQLISQPL